MLHQKLQKNSAWYREWHRNPRHKHVHWASLVATVFFMGSFLNNQIKSVDLTPPTSNINVIQSTSAVFNESTSHTLNLPNVAPGNAIVVAIAQTTSAAAKYSVADSQLNNYSPVVSENNEQLSQIFYATNVNGATSLAITITSDKLVRIHAVAVEVSAIKQIDDVARNVDAENSQSHSCARAGEFNPAANTFILCVGTLSGRGSTKVASSGYQVVSFNYRARTSAQSIFQYKIANEAIADERATWTTAAAQKGVMVIASFR